METVTACPLCGAPTSSVLYGRADVRVVLCESCGLVYLNPRMSQEARGTFYEESYQKQRNRVEDVAAAIVRAKQPKLYQKNLTKAEYFMPFIQKGSRVLDIGAGYGGLLAAIREKTGAIVEGIEPGIIGSEVGRRGFGLSVATTNLDEFLKTSHGTYDCVIMSHVLEHVGDPKGSLRGVRTLLKENGMLWLAVPNILTPDDAPNRFFHMEHLFYFSPRTLVHMLEEAGFAVVSLDMHPRELIVHAIDVQRNPVRVAREKQQGTPEDVRRVCKRHSRKYAVLTLLRKTIELILPRSASLSARSKAAAFLRKFGLIEQ